MKMTVVYPDGSSFVGDRKSWFPFQESRGIHHFIIESSESAEFQKLIGQMIAVPLTSAKYFVLNPKER